MYCYCLEKSEIEKKKKGSTDKNGSRFENFGGCLQVFVLWGLAGMHIGSYDLSSLFFLLLLYHTQKSE